MADALTPTRPQFFLLDSQVDLAEFEAATRAQLLPVLLEQESRALAHRFARALDAALFDTQHPIEDIYVHGDTTLEQLAASTIASMNSEQEALVALDSAFSNEFDPFLFVIRGKRTPSGIVLEVTSKSQPLSAAFVTLPCVSTVRAEDLNRATLFNGSHDWSMRLTQNTDLVLTVADLATVATQAPGAPQRAFELARLLLAEGSRAALARVPNGRLASAIGQVAVADPTALASILEQALPALPGLKPTDTIGMLSQSISYDTRDLIDSEIEHTLVNAF